LIYPKWKKTLVYLVFFRKSYYEALLAEYSHYSGAIALLREYRPYLEMIPSMRRPKQSVITIPLPVIKVRQTSNSKSYGGVHFRSENAVSLPCDVAVLTCDPDWKIKNGVEIFIFIHRPQEDFSDLLKRWRETQLLLSGDYEWIMPSQHQHILSEGTDRPYPLFVVLPGETPERILKGLKGAGLPFVKQMPNLPDEEPKVSMLGTEHPEETKPSDLELD